MESTPQVKKIKERYKKNPDICIVDFDIPLAIYPIKSVVVKDILEENVPEKYFIPKERSDEIIRIANLKRADRETDLVGEPPEEGDYVKHNHLTQNGKLSDKQSGTITCVDTPHVVCISNSASTGKKSQCNSVYDEGGLSPTLAAGTHGYAMGNILVR